MSQRYVVPNIYQDISNQSQGYFAFRFTRQDGKPRSSKNLCNQPLTYGHFLRTINYRSMDYIAYFGWTPTPVAG